MSYNDLLQRMKFRDADAFLEFTDRYGWSLYNAIRRNHPDKADADRIYQETMQDFYKCLQSPDCDDPVEALLCAWSEHVAYRRGFRLTLTDDMQTDLDEAPPALKARRLMETSEPLPEKKKLRFGTVIGVILLIVLLLVSIWIIAGFLMERQILPFVDLGYSWFCSMVEPYLQSLNLF